VGENKTFHLIVFLDAVIFTGGVDDPVSYVDKIQQIAELLSGQFNVHGKTPPVPWFPYLKRLYQTCGGNST
jgi:hypothetical protein